LSLRFNALWSVARIPLRLLKRILDHSKVRFTANLKLALRAQTVRFAPFRFTKNGYPKFFNVPPGNPGNNRSRNGSPLTLDEYPTFPADFAQGQQSSPKIQQGCKGKNLNSRSELVFVCPGGYLLIPLHPGQDRHSQDNHDESPESIRPILSRVQPPRQERLRLAAGGQ